MPRRLPTTRATKYGVRTDPAGKLARTADGILFDSKAEMRRYLELKLRERCKEIYDLELQPRFDLHVWGRPTGARIRVGHMTADFRYREGPTGVLRIEDVKSPATRRNTAYRLRKRMVQAEYNVTIIEVG